MKNVNLHSNRWKYWNNQHSILYKYFSIFLGFSSRQCDVQMQSIVVGRRRWAEDEFDIRSGTTWHLDMSDSPGEFNPAVGFWPPYLGSRRHSSESIVYLSVHRLDEWTKRKALPWMWSHSVSIWTDLSTDWRQHGLTSAQINHSTDRPQQGLTWAWTDSTARNPASPPG